MLGKWYNSPLALENFFIFNFGEAIHATHSVLIPALFIIRKSLRVWGYTDFILYVGTHLVDIFSISTVEQSVLDVY